MQFYLGVTDNSWYDYLSNMQPAPDDINFWQPGGRINFKALKRGELFVFKLKSPRNVIGGVGFFSSYSKLPLSMAWDIFGSKNGRSSLEEFRRTILAIRKEIDPNPTIGCIVLTNPLFFRREDWLPVPENWQASTQVGKKYNTTSSIDAAIWEQLQDRVQTYLAARPAPKPGDGIVAEADAPLYRQNVLSKVRVGQGAFRVLVTDGYQRRCSVTGEKTLPVLEAAHIKSYAASGPHALNNGILLRSDLHKLFDAGYLTITADHKIEVSNRIREEFQNGKEYYKHHGQSLLYLPASNLEQPAKQYIEWHNGEIFRG